SFVQCSRESGSRFQQTKHSAVVVQLFCRLQRGAQSLRCNRVSLLLDGDFGEPPGAEHETMAIGGLRTDPVRLSRQALSFGEVTFHELDVCHLAPSVGNSAPFSQLDKQSD